MTDTVTAAPVFEGLTLSGRVNVPDEAILANIAASIRRGHPQLYRVPEHGARVCLVGSGPSLATTEDELVDLVFRGAKLVTVNGSYHWALARHLRPHAQVVMDARPENARFLEPAVPHCRYYLASQCHPALWDAVEGREHVAIFHAVGSEAGAADLLNAYYRRCWQGVAGGTTVVTRAIGLLRMLGYLRFDLFGVDSCWMGGAHHAFDQPENAHETPRTLTVSPTGVDGTRFARTFTVSAWHIKQLEDILAMIRGMGHQFQLHVHGDGLLAYALAVSAEVAELEFADAAEVAE